MSIVVNKTRLPVTQWQTASGSVVSIADARKRYAKSLSVALEPIQDLSHGDPSPTNFCPISGRSSVSVYDDPKYGWKIWWNQLTKISGSDKTDTKSGVAITDNRNGSYTLDGTATAGFNFRIPDVTYTNGHVYLIHSHPDVCITNDMGYNTNKGSKLQVANASRLVLFSFYVTNGSVFDNVTVFPFVCDLTEMFGAGNEPTLEQFRALFPKDYYEYNAGTETLVSAVNGDPYISVTVQLGQTVYAGTVDLVSGVMAVEWAMDEAQNLSWIKRTAGFETDITSRKYGAGISVKSSHYKGVWMAGWQSIENGDIATTTNYRVLRIKDDENQTDMTAWNNYLTAQKTANTPVQIVYELATPQIIQLTAHQIEMLMRDNTIWSDDGIVTVNYARIRS